MLSVSDGWGSCVNSFSLQVADLRASKSDDKKFYVYSGTKTLEIRAETTQDRDFWIGILEVCPVLRLPSPLPSKLHLPSLVSRRLHSAAFTSSLRGSSELVGSVSAQGCDFPPGPCK